MREIFSVRYFYRVTGQLCVQRAGVGKDRLFAFLNSLNDRSVKMWIYFGFKYAIFLWLLIVGYYSRIPNSIIERV